MTLTPSLRQSSKSPSQSPKRQSSLKSPSRHSLLRPSASHSSSSAPRRHPSQSPLRDYLSSQANIQNYSPVQEDPISQHSSDSSPKHPIEGHSEMCHNESSVEYIPREPSPFNSHETSLLLDSATPTETSDNESSQYDTTLQPKTRRPLASVYYKGIKNQLRELFLGAIEDHSPYNAIYYAEKIADMSDRTNSDYLDLIGLYMQTGQHERALYLLHRDDLVQNEIRGRYFAAVCTNTLGRYKETLDYIGTRTPFNRKEWTPSGTIKIESLISLERGRAYMKMDQPDLASDQFVDALTIDARCCEAMDFLIDNKLLSEDIEWAFVTGLNYEEHCGSNDEVIQSLYLMKIRRYAHLRDVDTADNVLKNHLGLKDCTDILLSKADVFFSNGHYQEALQVCLRVRQKDPYYARIIPILALCYYELKMKIELYHLIMNVTDLLPDKFQTWYAAALYHMMNEEYFPARSYFLDVLKANPYMEYAWMGLGDACAFMSDYDSVIKAYKECNTMVLSSHRPYLALGKHYLTIGYLDEAIENLSKSYELCRSDPHVYLEMGIYYLKKSDYRAALDGLSLATLTAKDRHMELRVFWESLWCSFGECYRHLEEYDRAFSCFELAETYNGHVNDICISKGEICYLQGQYRKAIRYFEEAKQICTDKGLAEEYLMKSIRAQTKIASRNKKTPFYSGDAANMNYHIVDWKLVGELCAEPRPKHGKMELFFANEVESAKERVGDFFSAEKSPKKKFKEEEDSGWEESSL